MSTDDLTARVRDHLAHADTLPRGLAIALVSELADEVDLLRGERDRWKERWQATVADADAARAALERVKALVEDGDRLDGLWSYVGAEIRALLAACLRGATRG